MRRDVYLCDGKWLVLMARTKLSRWIGLWCRREKGMDQRGGGERFKYVAKQARWLAG